MKKTKRPALSGGTIAVLVDMQKRVNKASNPAQEASRLWDKKTSSSKRKNALSEVSRILHKMTSGRKRCMYCEDNEGTGIEHFWPKSVYPDRAFDWENYFWACTNCNSNEKRTQFPLDSRGRPILINPVDDKPTEHLVLVPETGHVVGVSVRGTTSENVFGLNRRDTLTDGRRDAFVIACSSLREYHRAKQEGRAEYAKQIADALRRASFSFVLQYVIMNGEKQGVPHDVVLIVQKNPEIRQWADA